MAKELPYLKFYPGEWMKGKITLCSIPAQGLFINVCNYYWMNDGNMCLTDVEQRFPNCSDEIKELLKNKVIKTWGDEGIYISFLDEQLEEFGVISEMRKFAGKRSGKMRRKKEKGTGVEHMVNYKEKIREEKRREEKDKRRKIIPPNLKMVEEYCSDRNNKVDPETFIDFYTSKNWMVGKNKMVDWQAAVRTWEKDDKKRYRQNTVGSRSTGNKPERKYRKPDIEL